MSLLPLTFLRFRSSGEASIPSLGKLEHRVMEEIWRGGETSVRDIQKALGDREAYTTIMTTLDRLHKKGLLDRRKEGRAFRYSYAFSREELYKWAIRNVMDALMGVANGSVAPVLTSFVDSVSARDRELLDELERLVQDKKKEIESKG